MVRQRLPRGPIQKLESFTNDSWSISCPPAYFLRFNWAVFPHNMLSHQPLLIDVTSKLITAYCFFFLQSHHASIQGTAQVHTFSIPGSSWLSTTSGVASITSAMSALRRTPPTNKESWFRVCTMGTGRGNPSPVTVSTCCNRKKIPSGHTAHPGAHDIFFLWGIRYFEDTNKKEKERWGGGGGFKLKPHIEVRFKWMWFPKGIFQSRRFSLRELESSKKKFDTASSRGLQ